jgi:DNA-binding NarL/FixJ family response regulator
VGITDESRRAAVSVLVVDDDPTSVRLILRILDSGGFKKVISTSSSAEAIEISDREKPDVVLLDLTMPEPDGFTILEAFASRAGDPRPRILVLSGHEHPAIERRAVDLGAIGAIPKTAGRDEILERLDATLFD